jgi:predicted O-linked N-acetylglucosamine transferase (SPINDLY family)
MSAPEKIFQKAVSALNQRDVAEAERLFKKLLRINPNHVAALNLLTAVLMGAGRFAEAEPVIAKAISLSTVSDAAYYNFGLILKRLNKPAQALQQFNQALHLNPAVPETWNNRGTVFNDLRKFTEAAADFDRAISLKPSYWEAYTNKGKSLAGLKRYDDAFTAYDKALALNPDLAEAWLGRGIVLAELKRCDEALAAYDKALALKPNLAEAWAGRGNVFTSLERYDEAFAAYDKAVALKPDLPEAWLGRGTVLAGLKRCDEALAAYDKALALKPDLTEAWAGRGQVLTGLKRFDEAFAAYDKTVALKPALAEAWLGRGNVYTELKQYDDAFAAYDQALSLEPDLAAAWLGRGNVYGELKRCDDAFAAYHQALSLEPDLAAAWLGRGNVYSELKQYDNAFAAYDQALTLEPDLAAAWLGRGNVYSELKQYDNAFAAYDQALNLEPDLAAAWFGRGKVYGELKQYDRALTIYDRALSLKVDLKYVEGLRLHSKMCLCNWTNIEEETRHLLSPTTQKLVTPFVLFSIPSSTADQLRCAKAFVTDQRCFPALWIGEIYSHDRIRVGYFSGDFRGHPVAHLAVGLLEQHDKSRVEITAISFGPDDGSDLRNSIKSAVENFIDVRAIPDDEIAQLIRDREIDVIVDLMGFTEDCRFSVLSRRVVPIQANFLGYPGTMGADFMDYIIADPTIIPKEHFPFYSEQVVWLPNTYLPTAYRRNENKHHLSHNERYMSQRVPTRAECNLPEAAFVFCCFNGSYKINPVIFDVWMRLLRAIPDSVLWLSKPTPTAEANLAKEAELRGVSPGRIIFAPRLREMSDHLARQRHADLFLDTLPYNAHTTASDALWAAVPVLTCAGQTFAGRVAASLLRAVGLPELVTTSLEDYGALALKLAHDPSFLQAIKAKLVRHRDTFPLFDTVRFTRHVEAAYVTMWERYQRGEKPQAFAVAAMD